MATRWHANVERRITELEALRDRIASCIGCGCLSIEECGLLNLADRAASQGSGPRYLMGDEPSG